MAASELLTNLVGKGVSQTDKAGQAPARPQGDAGADAERGEAFRATFGKEGEQPTRAERANPFATQAADTTEAPATNTDGAEAILGGALPKANSPKADGPLQKLLTDAPESKVKLGEDKIAADKPAPETSTMTAVPKPSTDAKTAVLTAEAPIVSAQEGPLTEKPRLAEDDGRPLSNDGKAPLPQDAAVPAQTANKPAATNAPTTDAPLVTAAVVEKSVPGPTTATPTGEALNVKAATPAPTIKSSAPATAATPSAPATSTPQGASVPTAQGATAAPLTPSATENGQAAPTAEKPLPTERSGFPLPQSAEAPRASQAPSPMTLATATKAGAGATATPDGLSPLLSAIPGSDGGPQGLTTLRPATIVQAPPGTPLPAPVQQVAEAIRVRTGEQTISVRLDPPDLGSVTVDFSIEKGRTVHAVISAEQTDTNNLLRRHADGLHKELMAAGFEEITVDIGDFAQDPNAQEAEEVLTILRDGVVLADADGNGPAGHQNILTKDRIDLRL